MLNSELPLNDKVTLYGFVTWSDRDNLAGGFYRQANDAGRNVPDVYPDGFLPLIRSKIEDSSIAAGARTELAGWDMDFSWNWGENVFDFDVEHSINASLGATSPTKVDSGGLELNSSSWNLDAVQELQSGWVVAWGVEIRSEEFIIREGEPASYCGPVDVDEGTPSCASYTDVINMNKDKSGGIQVLPGFRPANALSESRDSWALYAQSDWTFSNNVEVVLALRYEDYDSFGDVIVAKLAGRLPVSPVLALRGSINNGFRAPSLHQLYFNNISTQTQNAQLVEVGTFRNDSEIAKGLGIPELTEETSINFSLGFIYTPNDRFNITVDAYSIDIEDRVVISGQLEKPPLGNSPSAGLTEIVRIYDEFNIGRAQFFINLGETETRGLDISLNWLPEVSLGTLQVRLAANWTETDVSGSFKAPGLLSEFTSEDIFNAKNKSILETWQPESRISLSLDYRMGGWQVATTVQHVGGYKIVEEEGQQSFGAKILVDVKASYQLTDDLRLSIGAHNLFDEYPDEYKISGDSPRSGSIKDIVDSPGGIYKYANQSSPFGFNGAYYFIAFEYSLGEIF